MKSCWNSAQLTPVSTHWTLNSCFGVFRTIWLYLGPFRCLKKFGAKRAEMEQLMQKFVPQSRVGIFCNKRSRFTPLEPELLFWCISYSLGAFGIVSLPYITRCKMGGHCAINSKVRATKSCRNFSQRTLPIHPIGRYTHVLLRFILFGCIWDCFVVLRNSVQNGLKWCN